VARPRLYRALPEFLVPYENPEGGGEVEAAAGLHADDVREDMTRGWKDFDRSVKPVEAWWAGHHAAMKRLKHVFSGGDAGEL
jgi:deoxyribodipyrimidine photo-lyase